MKYEYIFTEHKNIGTVLLPTVDINEWDSITQNHMAYFVLNLNNNPTDAADCCQFTIKTTHVLNMAQIFQNGPYMEAVNAEMFKHCWSYCHSTTVTNEQGQRLSITHIEHCKVDFPSLRIFGQLISSKGSAKMVIHESMCKGLGEDPFNMVL